MSDTDILSEMIAPGVTLVTLNRPERLNAFTREAVARFNAVMDEIAADRACRAVVITGAGRGFCSGLDLAAATQRIAAGQTGAIEKFWWQEQFAGMTGRLRAMPQLVVAAVNGPAVGVGMALALSADVRVAATTARFLIASVRIGVTAGECGMSYLLPRMIGAPRAFDIMLTGRPIEAEEAERIGLVRALSAPDAVVADAVAYAAAVLANSPFSIKHTKKLMWQNLDASYETAVAAENYAQILGTMTEDYAEATKAFVEKRPANFQGR